MYYTVGEANHKTQRYILSENSAHLINEIKSRGIFSLIS